MQRIFDTARQPLCFRIYRPLVPVDHEFVEGILKVALCIRLTVKPAHVCFIITEEQLRFSLAVQAETTEFRMLDFNRAATGVLKRRLCHPRLPRPSIAEPNLG